MFNSIWGRTLKFSKKVTKTLRGPETQDGGTERKAKHQIDSVKRNSHCEGKGKWKIPSHPHFYHSYLQSKLKERTTALAGLETCMESCLGFPQLHYSKEGFYSRFSSKWQHIAILRVKPT